MKPETLKNRQFFKLYFVDFQRKSFQKKNKFKRLEFRYNIISYRLVAIAM